MKSILVIIFAFIIFKISTFLYRATKWCFRPWVYGHGLYDRTLMVNYAQKGVSTMGEFVGLLLNKNMNMFSYWRAFGSVLRGVRPCKGLRPYTPFVPAKWSFLRCLARDINLY